MNERDELLAAHEQRCKRFEGMSREALLARRAELRGRLSIESQQEQRLGRTYVRPPDSKLDLWEFLEVNRYLEADHGQ